MRRIIIFVAGVAVLAAPASVFCTGFGSLVSSFESPGANPYGIAYRPGQIYISAFSSHVVWRTTTTGSVIDYHPLRLAYNRGITVGTVSGETYYWVVDYETRYVYRYVDNSSSVHGSFPAPGTKPWGVAFEDATHIYYTDGNGNTLYYMHPMTGSIYTSYGLSFYGGDLDYDDDGYLWIACPHVDILSVFKCTLEGSTLASFSVAEYGHPSGCAYDGDYLWVSVYNVRNPFFAVMQYTVREEPGVAPTSLGKVKALFR